MKSRIHRKKPRARPMTVRTAKANERKSKVEHVFAHHVARMELTIRTVGLARAKAAVTMVNMAHNMGRLR